MLINISTTSTILLLHISSQTTVSVTIKMSLIPSNSSNNNSNSLTPFTQFTQFTQFPQHLWDNLFSTPLPSFPFPFPSPSHARTIPYSELAFESSGTVRAKLECKEVDEAHLIVAELPHVTKDEVGVTVEEGGFVRITGGDFSWRLRLPGDATVGMLSWSVENGVLTVVIPKVGVDYLMGRWDDWGNSGRRNVRQIDIQGSD